LISAYIVQLIASEQHFCITNTGKHVLCLGVKSAMVLQKIADINVSVDVEVDVTS